MDTQSSLFELRRKAERSLEDFDKVSLVTEDQTFGFRPGEILKRLQIRSQTHPAALMCERFSNAAILPGTTFFPFSGVNLPRDDRHPPERIGPTPSHTTRRHRSGKDRS